MLEEKPGRKERGARLAALFANESDREDLLLTVHDLLTQWIDYSYLLGMRQGYALAKVLKVGKGKRGRKTRANAKIVRVLIENPKAKNKEICSALDEAGIELYTSKSMPKGALFWSQVVKAPYYKNLISRMRKQVAKDTRETIGKI